MGQNKKEEYTNGLYNECSNNVEKFIAWMVDVNHYSVDGWIIRNLKTYIDCEEKLASFFERFAKVYKYDSSMLTQCSIDLIEEIKASLVLKRSVNG